MKNIQRLRDLISTIPADMIDMSDYRRYDDDYLLQECESVGCLVGHSSILDDKENLPRNSSGEIAFSTWSYNFYDTTLREWEFLFSSRWAELRETSSYKGDKEEALARIDYLLSGGEIPRIINYNKSYRKN